jgi:aldehyde:ferredoxin oxidoreductase
MYRGGYLGSVLRVDLTESTFAEEVLAPEVAAQYLGGAGLAVKLLYDEVPPDADPLSPENKLILATGPLTATFVPCTDVVAVAGKSPETGGAWWGVLTGPLSVALKLAGWDLLVVQGESARQVSLLVDDRKVELVEVGEGAAGGPAAGPRRLEQVLAQVNAPPRSSEPGHMGALDARRATGGLRAVMESKRLRAVAVAGSGTVPVSDPVKLRFAAVQMCQQLGGLPTGSPGAGRRDGCRGPDRRSSCTLKRLRGPEESSRFGGGSGLDFLPNQLSTPDRLCGGDLGGSLPATAPASSSRRLDHLGDRLDGEGRRRRWIEDLATATCDCPMMCASLLDTSLGVTVAENTAALIGAVTGVLFTPRQVVGGGKRGNALPRAFDVQAGLARGTGIPIPQDRLAGRLRASWHDRQGLLREYNEARGWDGESGVPTRASLEALGLSYVADRLQAAIAER